MNDKELLDFAAKFDLIKKSTAHFWKVIKCIQAECDDYYSDIISLLNFDCLVLQNWRLSYSIIFIDEPTNMRHNISFMSRLIYCNRCIGEFTVFFDDGGQIFDESLIIDQDKWVKRFCREISKTGYKDAIQI